MYQEASAGRGGLPPSGLDTDSSPRYQWVVLAMAVVATFAAMGLGRFGYSAILPSMQAALGLSGAEAGSLASWNLAGYTVMALGGGLLASKFGSRLIITLGLIITAGAMLFTGYADGLAAASVARLLAGMGTGMVIAPAIALMAAWFRPGLLGLASTIVSSGAGFGLILVGPIVPRVIEWGGEDGWRLAWFVLAAVVLAVAVLSGIVLRDRPVSGAAASASGGGGTGGVFRGFSRVLRSGYAWHLGLVYFLFGFAFMIFMTFFQKRLTADLGYSSETAGYLFLGIGIASVVCGLAYGVFSDRYGRGKAMAATLLLEACAASLFAARSGTALLAFAAVIFGSGAFSMPGLMGAACGERFGAGLAPASLGFVTIFIGLGQALGPYLGGALADASASYGWSYLLCAGVFVLAALAALLLDTRRGHTALPYAREGVTPGNAPPAV